MGGGDNGASRRAEELERSRQAMITRGTQRVNQIFSDPSREAQIGDVLNATRSLYTDDLNKQKADTDRQLKFAMARSGLAGGSTAIDKGVEVGENYVRGLTEAERRAQSAAADLRGQDYASKQNLLAMIQSGLDMNTAASQATSALRNNLDASRVGATAGGLGEMFGGFADIFRQSRENDARRRAEKNAYNTIYQSAFAPKTSKGGR